MITPMQNCVRFSTFPWHWHAQTLQGCPDNCLKREPAQGPFFSETAADIYTRHYSCRARSTDGTLPCQGLLQGPPRLKLLSVALVYCRTARAVGTLVNGTHLRARFLTRASMTAAEGSQRRYFEKDYPVSKERLQCQFSTIRPQLL